ncbi:hypothetical protein LA080_008435 [Diaporthe eres]|nr:hypothetical protein LA080_008435 [Diaporthe eres]
MVALDEEDRLQGWVSNCLAMNGGYATPGLNVTESDQHAREVHRGPAGFLGTYLPSTEHGCNYHGLVYNTTEEIVETLRLYRTQGRSTKIHCAGDWSVQVAMDAFEVLRAEGSAQKYHIAHGQFVTPEDRRRMKLPNVVAEVSPFIWYPGIIPQSIATVLPEEMASHMQPNRDLLDLGVLVAGALTGTLWEEQAVTVEEAIRIFSINRAKAANFIVIDRDPFTVDTTEIGLTKVLSTTVAGKETFSQSA